MITPMTRVEIVCLSAIRRELVRSLQEQGLLHLDEVHIGAEIDPSFFRKVALKGEAREEFDALEALERSINETLPLLSPEPAPQAIEDGKKQLAGMDEAARLKRVALGVAKLREAARKRAEILDRLDILQNYLFMMKTILPSFGSPDVKLGKGNRALVLTGNVQRAVEALEEKFKEAFGRDYKFLYNLSGEDKLVGFIQFPEDKGSVASAILSSQGIAPVDLSSQGFENATVPQVIERLNAAIASEEAVLREARKALRDASVEFGGELAAAKSDVTDRIARYRVHDQFSESEMVTVIQGWAPRESFAQLEETLEKTYEGKAVVTDLGDGGIPHGKIPTKLKNHPIFQPFELVLKLFDPPSYGTIDPTPMVAIAFVIFYGFILGDALYGLILLGVARWIIKKWGHNEIGKSVGTIATYMAISSIIFGVIYGEYFGNFVEKWLFPVVFGAEFHLYLFHRAHETTELLIYAILFGLVHIPMGLILGIREKLHHGHTKHAIEQLGMLLGLTAAIIYVCVFFQAAPLGIPLFAGAMTAPMTYLAAAMFIAGVILIFYSMGAMGMIGTLEIISLGANVLSYARLMALGIASIALADIANMLPGMMGYAIGIPAAGLVHAANIVIGVASPTIHSFRLNFVEFLPKFYSPEGTSFKPFRKETQW